MADPESQRPKALSQCAHRGTFRLDQRKMSHRVPKSGPEPLYSLEWSGERHSRSRFEQFARFQRGRPSLNNQTKPNDDCTHATSPSPAKSKKSMIELAGEIQRADEIGKSFVRGARPKMIRAAYTKLGGVRTRTRIALTVRIGHHLTAWRSKRSTIAISNE